MLQIIFYWSILLVFSALSGIAFQNVLKLPKTNISFTLLYGLIFQTLFLSCCAFFYRINFEVFVLNAFLQVIFFLRFKTEFYNFNKFFFTIFSKKTGLIFVGLIILIALKSAQLPTIFDNESYYIQTIKWLNEYGFVKGLVNIHPFLGQFSFWHVLQSGFNFSFFTNKSNDINGFILLIGIYYFFENYLKKGFNFSFLGILFFAIYFQFLDAPSPDLPILVISAIIFNEFIENSNNIKSIILFIVFMVFIKVMVAPFLLITVFYLIKNKKLLSYFCYISLSLGIIWIIKNIIITGYPLFPLQIFPTKFDWILNEDLMRTMFKNSNNLGYSENIKNSTTYTLIEKLNFWIRLNGLNGLFNKGILLLFTLIPFTQFFKKEKNFKILYFILLLHLLFLLLTSPQYRFFLPTFILFSSVLIYELLNCIKIPIKKSLLLFSMLLTLTSIFVDIKNLNNQSLFNLSQLIIPESNTKYENIEFKNNQIGNFNFYDANLYNQHETANGDLPCVNKRQIDYYKKHFQTIPQMRTNDIKDGFYAKKLTNE